MGSTYFLQWLGEHNIFQVFQGFASLRYWRFGSELQYKNKKCKNSFNQETEGIIYSPASPFRAPKQSPAARESLQWNTRDKEHQPTRPPSSVALKTQLT